MADIIYDRPDYDDGNDSGFASSEDESPIIYEKDAVPELNPAEGVKPSILKLTPTLSDSIGRKKKKRNSKSVTKRTKGGNYGLGKASEVLGIILYATGKINFRTLSTKLKDSGHAIIPMYRDSEQSKAMETNFAQAINSMEYKYTTPLWAKDSKSSADVRYSKNGYTPVATASSYHNVFARRLKMAIFDKIKVLFKEYAKHLDKEGGEWYLEQLLHKMEWNSKGSTHAEKKSMDSIYDSRGHISTGDMFFEGFLNCGVSPITLTVIKEDKAEEYHAVNDELNKLMKSGPTKVVKRVGELNSELNKLSHTLDIGPGKLLIHKSKVNYVIPKKNTTRSPLVKFHVGFRLTHDKTPFMANRNGNLFYEHQDLPVLPNNTWPTVSAPGAINASTALAYSNWSKQVFDPILLETQTLTYKENKDTKTGELEVVLDTMPSIKGFILKKKITDTYDDIIKQDQSEDFKDVLKMIREKPEYEWVIPKSATLESDPLLPGIPQSAFTRSSILAWIFDKVKENLNIDYGENVASADAVGPVMHKPYSPEELAMYSPIPLVEISLPPEMEEKTFKDAGISDVRTTGESPTGLLDELFGEDTDDDGDSAPPGRSVTIDVNNDGTDDLEMNLTDGNTHITLDRNGDGKFGLGDVEVSVPAERKNKKKRSRTEDSIASIKAQIGNLETELAFHKSDLLGYQEAERNLESELNRLNAQYGNMTMGDMLNMDPGDGKTVFNSLQTIPAELERIKNLIEDTKGKIEMSETAIQEKTESLKKKQSLKDKRRRLAPIREPSRNTPEDMATRRNMLELEIFQKKTIKKMLEDSVANHIGRKIMAESKRASALGAYPQTNPVSRFKEEDVIYADFIVPKLQTMLSEVSNELTQLETELTRSSNQMSINSKYLNGDADGDEISGSDENESTEEESDSYEIAPIGYKMDSTQSYEEKMVLTGELEPVDFSLRKMMHTRSMYVPWKGSLMHDIRELAFLNSNYRRILTTAPHMQITLMSVPHVVPNEMHADVTKFIYLVKGKMKITMWFKGGVKFETKVATGQIILIPCGVSHKIINDCPCIEKAPLKLYVVYSKPVYSHGTAQVGGDAMNGCSSSAQSLMSCEHVNNF